MIQNRNMTLGRCPRTMLRTLDGTTLLEVLVAMVVVSVVILGVAGFSTVSIKGTAFGQKMTIAVTLAQDKLEALRLQGYQPLLSGTVKEVEAYGAIVGASLFERTVVINADTPARGLQTVTVKVAWDHDAHSTSLATILAE